MANGNVYVFNATPNQIGLSLNGYPLTTIAGIASSNSYAANSTTVARNASPGNPGLGQFGGQNSLLVYFPNGGGDPQTYTVNINSQQVPMTQDLQLYIFFSELVLVSPSSQVNETGTSQVLTGTPASDAEVQELSGGGAATANVSADLGEGSEQSSDDSYQKGS